MACQFTLPLEPLSALTSRAAPDGAVVGPQRGVDVGVGVEQVLGLERGDTAAGGFANKFACLRTRYVIDAPPVRGGARGRGDLLLTRVARGRHVGRSRRGSDERGRSRTRVPRGMFLFLHVRTITELFSELGPNGGQKKLPIALVMGRTDRR